MLTQRMKTWTLTTGSRWCLWLHLLKQPILDAPNSTGNFPFFKRNVFSTTQNHRRHVDIKTEWGHQNINLILSFESNTHSLFYYSLLWSGRSVSVENNSFACLPGFPFFFYFLPILFFLLYHILVFCSLLFSSLFNSCCFCSFLSSSSLFSCSYNSENTSVWGYNHFSNFIVVHRNRFSSHWFSVVLFFVLSNWKYTTLLFSVPFYFCYSIFSCLCLRQIAWTQRTEPQWM